MEDNLIDKVQEAIAGWRGLRSSAASSLRTVEPLLTQGALRQSRSTADPNHRQEESMSSVLLIGHHEARKQPTGVPRSVASGAQRGILETRATAAKLRCSGFVMLLALPGLVFAPRAPLPQN